MSLKKKYRRSVSMNPETYLKLEALAVHEGMSFAKTVESLVDEAHKVAELPQVDPETLRMDIDSRRRTPLRPVNPRRAAKRRAECFGEQAKACRVVPCCVCGNRDRIADPHHEPPRSLGGKDSDTIPLCRQCHHDRHFYGATKFWGEIHRSVDPNEVKERMREAVARGN